MNPDKSELANGAETARVAFEVACKTYLIARDAYLKTIHARDAAAAAHTTARNAHDDAVNAYETAHMAYMIAADAVRNARSDFEDGRHIGE